MYKIYEIKFDINSNINIIDKIAKFKSLGDFTIFNNIFYVSTDKEQEDIKQLFHDIISIHEINISNYSNIINVACREWCFKIICENEIKKFEMNNQKPLEHLNKKLDFLLELQEKGKLEDYLKENIMNKKGSDTIGERSSTKTTG